MFYLISIGLISHDKEFSRLFFPIKFPVITEVKLDLEEDTSVKYLSSINPFPLGSKPLQPAPGIYNSAQACKSNLTSVITGNFIGKNNLENTLSWEIKPIEIK